MAEFLKFVAKDRSGTQVDWCVNLRDIQNVTKNNFGNAVVKINGDVWITEYPYENMIKALSEISKIATVPDNLGSDDYGITPAIASMHGVDINDKEACRKLSEELRRFH